MSEILKKAGQSVDLITSLTDTKSMVWFCAIIRQGLVSNHKALVENDHLNLEGILQLNEPREMLTLIQEHGLLDHYVAWLSSVKTKGGDICFSQEEVDTAAQTLSSVTQQAPPKSPTKADSSHTSPTKTENGPHRRSYKAPRKRSKTEMSSTNRLK